MAWARLAGAVLAVASAGACRSAEPGAAGEPPPASSRGELGAPAAEAPLVQPSARGAAPASAQATGSTQPGSKTAGIVEVRRGGPPRLLRAVRAAQSGARDRVVFELEGAVPGFHIEYVDKPVRGCGAGEVRSIEGDGWLEVRLMPAQAHTDEGVPVPPARELRPALPVVRELELTCDFEAVVTWVIGTASPNRYRAFELSSPPRLVIDIEH